LGSILRTAEATGVDTVIIPKKESVGLTPAVLRASMGGALHVPLIRDSLYRAAKLLRQEGVTLIGIDPTATTRYYDTRLTGSVAIILGGEDQGLNSTLQNQCHSLARIPMYGAITTLNVSAATAVTLYERTRQQTNNKNRRITP
jgi:23S rRNA (guanosine2251-2'-O)-methyltransferase